MELRRRRKKVPPKKTKFFWEKFQRRETSYHDYEYPKVGIIVPTLNCGQVISLTLDSLVNQNYPDFEVIIVDAGSTDRTLEIIKGYRDDRIQIYSVSSYQRYEMLNKGISQTDANYLNFLFPGDYYIYHDTLKTIMTLALDHGKPSLVFCGALLREGTEEQRLMYRHLTLKLLRKGKQPTSLQSFWFCHDVFSKIGKFDTQYVLRGGFDLICRYCLHKNLKTVSTSRVLTDYAIRSITRKNVITHFTETTSIIYKNFGLWRTFIWLIIQKDGFRYLKLWWNNFKTALLGR